MLVLVTTAVVLLTAGCGLRQHTVTSPTATTGPDGTVHVPSGSSTQSLLVDGRTRSFRLYLPAGLPLSHPVPLVVMLHGGFGDDAQAEAGYGWDQQATSQGFVVAYPNGDMKAWNGGGGCCGQPGRENIDDVAFISQMVAKVRAELPIDARRVYATGISNGGIMAYRLACDTTIFAAIGPDSATRLGSCDHPAPISVIHIHGTADHNIPYAGGGGSGVAKIDGPPVTDVVADWQAVDRCAPPSSTTSGVVTRSVATCPDGREVELITIAGAGHQWPGSFPPGPVGRALGIDIPSKALDATSTIWAFFAAHPAPAT
jgi:polyhydroxybutyrate depolymerase